MEKLLTISIAAYNVEKFLDDTLSSLMCSKNIMDKLEVFIVDDESSDNTEKIARQYAGRYPDTFIYVKKKNGGHGSTLNYSIHHSSAKYFKMLDGDDWVEKEALEQLVELLEKIDVDVVLSPYKRIYEGGTQVEHVNRHQLVLNQEYQINCMDAGILEPLHAHEVTVKTCVLKEKFNDITEKCVYTDDEYIFNVIRSANTFLKTENEIYCYRVGLQGQTVSDRGRLKHLNDAKKISIAMLIHNKEWTNDKVSTIKKDVLYQHIARTLSFQIDTYMLLDDIQVIIRLMDELEREINDIDNDFWSEYVIRLQEYNVCSRIISLYQNNNGEEYVIAGAGKYGTYIGRLLKDKVQICCYADNSVKKIGLTEQGIKILSVHDAVNSYGQYRFFISSLKSYDVFKEQLLDEGVNLENII